MERHCWEELDGPSRTLLGELRGDKVSVVPLPFKPPPLQPISPADWIRDVHEAWIGAPDRDHLCCDYSVFEFHGPEERAAMCVLLKSNEEHAWRKPWLKLFVFAAMHGLGRVEAGQANQFITWLGQQNVGQTSFLDVFSRTVPDPDNPDASCAWLQPLYEQGRNLAAGGAGPYDRAFRIHFATLHRIAWHLSGYRSNFLFFQNQGPNCIQFQAMLDPNINNQAEGVLPALPSLQTTLGPVGLTMLVRELVRAGFLAPGWGPYSFVPRKRTLERLGIDHHNGISLRHSLGIHQTVCQALQVIPDADPTFGGHFDIPLLAAIDGHLQLP